MKKLLTIATIILSTSAMANLDSFKVSANTANAVFNKAQVEKMLGEGNTCVKKGRKTYFASKNISKKQCSSSTKLGLRVIKVKDLELSLYKKVMGFKS